LKRSSNQKKNCGIHIYTRTGKRTKMRISFLSSIFLSLLTLWSCNAQDNITYSGYLIDNMCYDKCFAAEATCPHCALDKTNVIRRPEEHHYKCLLAPYCRENGFYLAKNVGTESDPNYRPLFLLGPKASMQAMKLLKAAVAINPKQTGFMVTVTGQKDGYSLTNAKLTQCKGGKAACDGVCIGCTSENIVPQSYLGPDPDLVIIHGALLFVAWVVLAPMAFLIKRFPHIHPALPDLSQKKLKGLPLHFLLHGFMMLTVVIFTIAGVGIALGNFGRPSRAGKLSVSLFHVTRCHEKQLSISSYICILNQFSHWTQSGSMPRLVSRSLPRV